MERPRELQSVHSATLMYGYMLACEMFASRLAMFFSILSYILFGNSITAEKVFMLAAYCNILKVLLTDFLPRAVAQVAEAYVSSVRVQKFLLYDEVETQKNFKNESGHLIDQESKINELAGDQSHEGSMADKTRIKITCANVKWSPHSTDNTLTNINLDVTCGELVAVIGPVGAGKTSILQALLGELPVETGSITINGCLSYASQEPWLFAGTVRQNILFGQPMNKDWYQQVVKACALERDFHLMLHGDRTIVGERGVTLSGGQRARINLARAVYRKADIYLLDDPLSAVDAHVGRMLFDSCICDLLKNKTRILVTHQLQYLQTADLIVVLNNGVIEVKGTFEELQMMGSDFTRHLKQEAAVEVDSYAKEKRYTLSTSSQLSLDEPMGKEEREVQSRGKIKTSVYGAYWSAGGHCCIILIVFVVCILSQAVISAGDYWMSFWTKVEEGKEDNFKFQNSTSLKNLNHTKLTAINSTSANLTEQYEEEDTAINSTSGWLPSTEFCIMVYGFFMIATIFLSLTSVHFFIKICVQASTNLHNSVLKCVTHSVMKFFNTNSSGQILNRFSKDMGNVDELLPRTLIDCVQLGLIFLGVVTLVSIVNIWMLIPTVGMALIFYLLRLFYVGTSRSLKRLEGVTRTPVFSHLNATLQGLTTIRAYSAQKILTKEFDDHQDLYSSATYLFIATSRAFGLWLDMTCVGFIAFVSFGFLFIGDVPGGNVGLAITQVIGLTMSLQWGVRQSAEMENQMTSVERLVEYTQIEQEAPLESEPSKKPPDDWPTQGEVIFSNVFLKYGKNEPPVLKDVNFIISPGAKVGIVGRTGAGKTSLITALFRLEEISEGSIYIDKVDTSKIGLHDLRKKISIIPQEPMLFSGSLRDNLDPFQQYSDVELWSALAEVELKQVIDELSAGLNHKVSEGGLNFSVGQRQLICLARAIVRNNKILVLDEATANVDPQTDELIQATIRRKFQKCTVLTIAHRLHTVMDSDQIIVMDAGHVVEMDHPYNLLRKKHGFLYDMVQQTGSTMAESLFQMAQSSYKKTTDSNLSLQVNN